MGGGLEFIRHIVMAWVLAQSGGVESFDVINYIRAADSYTVSVVQLQDGDVRLDMISLTRPTQRLSLFMEMKDGGVYRAREGNGRWVEYNVVSFQNSLNTLGWPNLRSGTAVLDDGSRMQLTVSPSGLHLGFDIPVADAAWAKMTVYLAGWKYLDQ